MIFNYILAITAVTIVVALGYGLLRLAYFVHASGQIVEKSSAYEQTPENTETKILILGDSTALGTGADNPQNSVAGRLGQDFPTASVINKAENGMRSDQLLDRLDGLLIDESYDLIVIHIGANDVLRMRKLERTKQNIGLIVDRSLNNADNVALFTSGNIGEAKLIPWFARPLMSKRSLKLRDFGIELESEIDNFVYVDLYYKDSGLPSSDFYADDQLHLSDKGYGLWHQELRNALKKHTGLYY